MRVSRRTTFRGTGLSAFPVPNPERSDFSFFFFLLGVAIGKLSSSKAGGTGGDAGADPDGAAADVDCLKREFELRPALLGPSLDAAAADCALTLLSGAAGGGIGAGEDFGGAAVSLSEGDEVELGDFFPPFFASSSSS